MCRQSVLEKEIEKLHVELIKTKYDKDRISLSVKELHSIISRMEKEHSNALIAAEAKYKSSNSTSNTNVQRDVIQAAEREKELENMVSLP